MPGLPVISYRRPCRCLGVRTLRRRLTITDALPLHHAGNEASAPAGSLATGLEPPVRSPVRHGDRAIALGRRSSARTPAQPCTPSEQALSAQGGAVEGTASRNSQWWNRPYPPGSEEPRAVAQQRGALASLLGHLSAMPTWETYTCWPGSGSGRTSVVQEPMMRFHHRRILKPDYCAGLGVGWLVFIRRSARYSYRYFSESASVCSMSAIVSSGIRSWASVTSAEAGWASAGSHSSGFQAALRSSDLGQCG